MSQKMEDILNNCLERMLEGESIEDCLKDYPWQASELEPLLKTSFELIQKSAAIQPAPEFKVRVYLQLQERLHAKREAAQKKVEKKTVVSIWHRRWAMAMTTVLVVFLAGAGTIMASTDALPDEPLYAVKMATEHARIALASSDEARAELHIQCAGCRIVEIAEVARQGKSDEIAGLTEQVSNHLSAVHVVELTRGPVEVEEVPQLLAPAPGAFGGTGNYADDKGESEEKLKVMLNNSRAKNLDALQTVLAEVPEEDKAFLEQAIIDVTEDYDETIAKLEKNQGK